jgi:hypothetical protein
MPMPSQPQPQLWPRFLRTALASLAMVLALAVGLIAVMNPYGNLPVRAFGAHVIMDTNDGYPGLPAEPGRSKGRPREDRDVGRYGASGNT